MYGMYVHIKAVIYLTFPNKQDFLPKLIRQKYKLRGIVKHVYILAVCPYNVCDVLPCQLNMALDHAERSLRYHVKRELPKHKKSCERTHGVMTHYVLILMIYGIINLHNHMHLFTYLDVLPSTVVFHFH